MVRMVVELPEDVAEGLSRLADDHRSTPEALLTRWASEAVATRSELMERVRRGLADLEEGRTVPHEEVMAELEAWAQDVEAKHRMAG